MLAPIPSAMLQDSVVFHVVSGVDSWQKKTFTDYAVKNVHLQDANETRKTANNTEVSLKGILFVDARRSLPRLDYMALQAASQANGGVMTCSVTSGGQTREYTVLTIDSIPNVPATSIHHTEIGLV